MSSRTGRRRAKRCIIINNGALWTPTLHFNKWRVQLCSAPEMTAFRVATLLSSSWALTKSERRPSGPYITPQQMQSSIVHAPGDNCLPCCKHCGLCNTWAFTKSQRTQSFWQCSPRLPVHVGRHPGIFSFRRKSSPRIRLHLRAPERRISSPWGPTPSIIEVVMRMRMARCSPHVLAPTPDRG